MAQREALRELQSRLAQRLQAARTEQRPASWLALESAGHGFLVALPSAGEIFPAGALFPVPHTRTWFAGVANLRGLLHGVVDLAGFLGLRPTLAAGDAVRDNARLLALNASLGAHCALLVESLAGLRGADQLQPEPEPAEDPSVHTPARPPFAGPRLRDADGRVWQVLDLPALARDPRFLDIGR